MLSNQFFRFFTPIYQLILVLVLVNLLAIAFFDFEIGRLFRLISTGILFAYMFFKKQKANAWILMVIGLLVFKDVALQFYELAWGHKFYLLLGTLAYGVLVLERLPKLANIKINPSVIVVTSVLVAANTYTLYTIMDMLSYQFTDGVEITLFYLYGALMIILGVAAITYNNKYNSNRSLLFVFLAFGFIFADIAALFAYYFDFPTFYYLDRVLYLIGVGLLVNYGLNYESAKEEFFQYEMIEKKF